MRPADHVRGDLRSAVASNSTVLSLYTSSTKQCIQHSMLTTLIECYSEGRDCIFRVPTAPQPLQNFNGFVFKTKLACAR
jgi:hypothetical protein